MIPQWEQDIINAKNREHVFVIEWLDKDENVIGEITADVISGSINLDATRQSRRSANLVLNNVSKEYIPNPNNKLWINNKFALYAGYKYGNNQTLLYRQGIFVLGNPSVLSSPIEKEVTIVGLDKWALLDGTLGGQTKNKIIIPVDERVDNAIKLLLELIGESKYIIDPCDVVLPYTIEKEPGINISDIFVEIANIVSYNCFYDNNGYFRFRKALKPEDYNTTPISWEYNTSGLYLGSTRNLKWSDVRNSIKVIGMTLDNGITISAEAKDETGSDLSIDQIGERFELIEDDNIFREDLAQDRADWELQQRIMIAEEVSMSTVPNFSHQLEDVIRVTDENNGVNGNYLIQSISYNLSFDTEMTLGLWAIRDWR